MKESLTLSVFARNDDIIPTILANHDIRRRVWRNAVSKVSVAFISCCDNKVNSHCETIGTFSFEFVLCVNMSESAEKSDTNKTAVTIPKSLSDVNSSWLSNLLKVIDLDFSENFVGLSHLQILPFETPHEGMFDQCRVSVEYQRPKR